MKSYRLLLIAGCLCAAGTAAATPAADRAAALFDQGLAALRAGRTAEACDKLAESVATLPDSGAKGALAECNTALGRLPEAWQLWRELAASAPTAELREDAARNAAALDHKLARVVIHVAGVAPPDLVITLNDKPVTASAAAETRVLPGTLVVVADAPDVERWTHTYQATAGAQLAVDIHTTRSRSATRHRHRGRVVGAALTGAGVLAIGVGAVFGRATYADWDSATRRCGDVEHCKGTGYADAQKDLSNARRSATVASWAMGAGAVVATTGIVVYLLYREPHYRELAWRPAPLADAHTVGLAFTRSLP